MNLLLSIHILIRGRHNLVVLVLTECYCKQVFNLPFQNRCNWLFCEVLLTAWNLTDEQLYFICLFFITEHTTGATSRPPHIWYFACVKWADGHFYCCVTHLYFTSSRFNIFHFFFTSFFFNNICLLWNRLMEQYIPFETLAIVCVDL